ncbi:MAG TPA: multidrug efflux SMR transporter [Candidatus Acidoferrales bacterium]|jgi:quaternary ammonium compound-resistance protein SugE
MAWLLLFIAGLCEVAWAITLKYSEGFTRLWPTVGVLVGGLVSVYLLGLAAKQIPIGTAYAVWTGVGAIGTALLGIALFDEPRTALRLGCMTLIVAGIAGLRLLSPR